MDSIGPLSPHNTGRSSRGLDDRDRLGGQQATEGDRGARPPVAADPRTALCEPDAAAQLSTLGPTARPGPEAAAAVRLDRHARP